MALDKIRLIASYERKIIRRHLSFWIFLICIVFGIAGVQWYLQVDSPVWAESALSATVPYMNAWFFNLLQSLLVIFVGVEFVWRDRRLGTNETKRGVYVWKDMGCNETLSPIKSRFNRNSNHDSFIIHGDGGFQTIALFVLFIHPDFPGFGVCFWNFTVCGNVDS